MTQISEEKDKRLEALQEIKDKILNLKDSPLFKYRKEHDFFPVIGEGNRFAKIMFIGEAPGKNEALTGRPFCGRAGALLDELLEFAGIKREEVYITNIVKDRPPENRDPSPEEIKVYGPFLDRQIEIIRPELIVTLGRYSMNYILEKFKMSLDLEPISKAHGKIFETKTSYGKIKIIPQYHPAAAIYNQHLKETLKKDFEILSKKNC